MTNSPDLGASYVTALRFHAHELIAMGYERMQSPDYVKWEEPAITGELIRAMNKFIDSYDAPNWAVRYIIRDDPPLNVPGKYGKYRPKVDIEFERTGVRGPRPRLRFEAKRLCAIPEHTVGTYLGADGMGCFISGKYPNTHGEAGMLGYVQSGNEKDWSDKIEKALANKREQYRVAQPPFHRQQICSLGHTYVSHHNSQPHSSVIIIHHVLLRFH